MNDSTTGWNPLKALNSLREMCVVFGEDLDAVSVSDETQNPKQHLREAYTCRRAFANKHTFPRKKIRETAHIPFKGATFQQSDWSRENRIVILYLFCWNAQPHITVILKMKAGVIWEIVVHLVGWFPTSLY